MVRIRSSAITFRLIVSESINYFCCSHCLCIMYTTTLYYYYYYYYYYIRFLTGIFFRRSLKFRPGLQRSSLKGAFGERWYDTCRACCGNTVNECCCSSCDCVIFCINLFLVLTLQPQYKIFCSDFWVGLDSPVLVPRL